MILNTHLKARKILFASDFNASGSENNRCWNADENLLAFRDVELPAGSFTYLSPSHHTTSWIDHILTSTCVFVCKVINLCSIFASKIFSIFHLILRYLWPKNLLKLLMKDWRNVFFFLTGTKNVYSFNLSKILVRLEVCLKPNCNAPRDHSSLRELFHRNLVKHFIAASEHFEYEA